MLPQCATLLGRGLGWGGRSCAYSAVCLLRDLQAATWLSRIPERELVYLRHSQPALTAAAAVTASRLSITYPPQRLARDQRGHAGFHSESPDISFISQITYKHKRGRGKEPAQRRRGTASRPYLCCSFFSAAGGLVNYCQATLHTGFVISNKRISFKENAKTTASLLL